MRCAAVQLFRSIINTIYPSTSVTYQRCTPRDYYKSFKHLPLPCPVPVASTTIRLKGNAAGLGRKAATSATTVRE